MGNFQLAFERPATSMRTMTGTTESTIYFQVLQCDRCQSAKCRANRFGAPKAQLATSALGEAHQASQPPVILQIVTSHCIQFRSRKSDLFTKSTTLSPTFNPPKALGFHNFPKKLPQTHQHHKKPGTPSTPHHPAPPAGSSVQTPTGGAPTLLFLPWEGINKTEGSSSRTYRVCFPLLPSKTHTQTTRTPRPNFTTRSWSRPQGAAPSALPAAGRRAINKTKTKQTKTRPLK